MIKFRIPTHYNHFRESDLIDYYNRCYYGEEKSFTIVNDDNYDFLLLINRTIYNKTHPVSRKCKPYYKFDKKKTIIFQNEPLKKRQKWKRSSPAFINPNPGLYKKVFNIKNYHNLVLPVYKFDNIVKESNKVISFISRKRSLPLQKIRSNFYRKRIVSNTDIFIDHPVVKEDYISKFTDCNYSYEGNRVQQFFDDRYQGYLPHKYVMQSESLDELNYFTEKIIEPIMCECLTFYSGCSNLDKFIDDRCFIRVDFSKLDEAMDIIKQAIENDEWSKRIQYIRREKDRIHKEMSFLRIAENLINTKG